MPVSYLRPCHVSMVIGNKRQKKRHALSTVCYIDDMDIKTLGHNLKVARVAAGYTQRELAALSSLHTRTVCAIEQGRYGGKIETWLALAQALQMSLPDLLAHRALHPEEE